MIAVHPRSSLTEWNAMNVYTFSGMGIFRIYNTVHTVQLLRECNEKRMRLEEEKGLILSGKV